ncbi:MAG: hypothetical protein CVT97_08720, partial [Bacteroidetes bacterium HGW-Bacteroidetes-14]
MLSPGFQTKGWGQNETFTTSGTFTVPAGVTEITVECWGAGGGGSTRTSNAGGSGIGGGGGGGAYSRSVVPVTPGSIYSVEVGTGGEASSPGGNSSFNSVTVVAAGGSGGVLNSTTAGAGGTSANSTGALIYAGGNGADGFEALSGGGGGGAGSTGQGKHAIGATGGAATTANGGKGGDGVSGSNNGLPGSNYGGGGSGAVRSNGINYGGTGANGLVIITYVPNTTITTSTITGSPFCAGASVSVPYTISGTFTSGNVFTAQLSNSAGSFATPVNIGALTSTTAGAISGTIPAGTLYGTGYRIRVVSSTPAIAGTDNGSDIAVYSFPLAPATTGSTICIGSSATLSASGAGVGDRYKWYSAATGGTLLKTSTSNTDNTYTTPTLASTTNYWVSIINAGGCEGPRTQVTATFPALSGDNQNAAGSNSWIGHVYDGTNQSVAFNGNFTSYYGSYTETETFDQGFGGSQNCFGFFSNSVARSIYTETYSVRYRMSSSRKGLFIADMGSDDGGRLAVDGALVYNNWSDQAFTSRPRVLMSMNGASSLVYDFYENGGLNRVVFQNLTQLIANNLAGNIEQTLCAGETGAAISGDVFGSLPVGISLSGTGYQWTYSTTPGGTRTNIAGATGANYVPNSAIAPFNTPGTYYIYRNATLSSANNVAPNPYIATNESNAATITVQANLPASVSIAASANPICAGTSVTFTATPTNGGTSP